MEHWSTGEGMGGAPGPGLRHWSRSGGLWVALTLSGPELPILAFFALEKGQLHKRKGNFFPMTSIFAPVAFPVACTM